jgi:hypothetical protein
MLSIGTSNSSVSSVVSPPILVNLPVSIATAETPSVISLGIGNIPSLSIYSAISFGTGKTLLVRIYCMASLGTCCQFNGSLLNWKAQCFASTSSGTSIRLFS